MALALPVGLNPTTIGVSASWWLETARRAEAAGLDSVWAWDHFISRGQLRDPMLECWTLLAATAAVTRRVRVGSLVTNVMNRHPALLARMVATLADLSPGRVELGIGIGGHPAEHEAYGMAFPDASERAARLEEAVTVLRLLLAGGPADFEGRFYRLVGAHAFPAPQPPPRILVAGETPAGARLAARIGDAWTCSAPRLDRLMPLHREALASVGRHPSSVAVVVGVAVDSLMADPVGTIASLAERGADELIVERVRPLELDGLLAAVARPA